jgi:hypothetical protein
MDFHASLGFLAMLASMVAPAPCKQEARPAAAERCGQRACDGSLLDGSCRQGVDAKAKDNEAAKAFVKFISAPAAAAAYKAKGLDPG